MPRPSLTPAMPEPGTMSAVFLVGYRGSGKTSVGRVLASRLGWEFADTDRLVEERSGKSIAALFSEEGEEAFRTYQGHRS